MPLTRETAALVHVALPEPLELLHATFVRHRFAPHAHETFALAVVESGAGRSRYRTGVAHYRPGGVVVVEPGEPHDGEPEPGGWRYRALYPAAALVARLTGVDVGGAAAAGAAPARGRRLFASSFVPDAALAARLAAAHAALVALPRGDALHAETLLAEALGALFRRHACATATRLGDRGDAARAVRAARALLHEAYAEPLSLAALAGAAQLAPARLSRVFRAEVGLPPHAYLELVRVEEAKRRLRRGDPIADVAFATGFSDQSHLTRRFRRVVGVTPGVYVRAFGRRRVA